MQHVRSRYKKKQQEGGQTPLAVFSLPAHHCVVVVSDASGLSWFWLRVGRSRLFQSGAAVNAARLGCHSSSDRGLLEETAERQEPGHADAEQGH